MKVRIENKKRKWLAGPYIIDFDGNENVICVLNGREIPSQLDIKNKKIVVLLPDIEQNESVEIEIKQASIQDSQVKLINKPEKGVVDITIGEEYFSTYHYGSHVVRPYLNPLITVQRKSVLRPPVPEDNPEKLDHVHHRGVWVAHGDINGVDNWSEIRDHGWTVHQDFVEILNGPVFGRLHAKSYWMDNSKTRKICEEERIITIYNMPASARIIDHVTVLKATEGELVFRDTKESGLLSVRVMPSMQADNQGAFENAIGGKNEDECWGKRAQWCDYYGPVDGVVVGVSVFDYPTNLRYPTWWHIRNYGLFSANFFGLSEFTGDKKISGTYILPAYQEMRLFYRIYVHEGDTKQADVSLRYLNLLYPPSISKT
ncbi:MAG: PmoA family protein [bacterium]|nr:PmoA family protein [bacterium]